ncbi:hypothetical protein M440DRAFT_214144 [Trichoderma longibrachiatum ATCC 18648]|uniref:Uncharacterized protein n=1 Tax=Trichoderma longibrachiatum ATCC 18648 TaxID=983965 RepID=A0A2T4BQA4_TRILO|nr:hypothetical protein M440DRAFT_214144 [Trichoderma longibrachiatum ATCC 18648]
MCKNCRLLFSRTHYPSIQQGTLKVEPTEPREKRRKKKKKAGVLPPPYPRNHQTSQPAQTTLDIRAKQTKKTQEKTKRKREKSQISTTESESAFSRNKVPRKQGLQWGIAGVGKEIAVVEEGIPSRRILCVPAQPKLSRKVVPSQFSIALLHLFLSIPLLSSK